MTDKVYKSLGVFADKTSNGELQYNVLDMEVEDGSNLFQLL